MKLSQFETLEKFQQVREQLDPGLFITALLAALAAAYVAAAFYRFFTSGAAQVAKYTALFRCSR